jgi:flagellar motor protein MotB
MRAAAVKDPQDPITTETDGLAPRRLAWKVLEAVAAGAFADNALERELARTNLAPLDRGLATELAYGAIRQRFLLDAWIDAHGRLKANRQPPRLRWLLHVGLYQLLFSSRVPASAAVNTSVQLAKEAGFARLAPVVNGLLRAVARVVNQLNNRVTISGHTSASVGKSAGDDWALSAARANSSRTVLQEAGIDLVFAAGTRMAHATGKAAANSPALAAGSDRLGSISPANS